MGIDNLRKESKMLKTDELVKEAVSLPVEIRAQLIDKLLKSLNPAQEQIDKIWATEAEKRVGEIKSGKVETISGEEVFKKIRNRLNS